MKNLVKNGFYTISSLVLIGLTNVNAAISVNTVQDNIVGSSTSADVTIQNWLSNLLTFLYLAAVLILIWGGFNILTASGDEEKVKKGKTIILQALAGILVIFLAGSIIQWLFGSILA